MNESLESARVSVLIAEYERVYQEVLTMQRKSETLFGFGISALGVGLLYGIVRSIPGVWSLLTLFLLILFLYVAVCYNVIMSLSGYRQYLEELINRNIQEEWLIWERHIAKPLLHKSAQMVALWAFLMLLPIGSFVMSLHREHNMNQVLFWMYMVIAAILGWFCFRAAYILRTASDRAYQKANDYKRVKSPTKGYSVEP